MGRFWPLPVLRNAENHTWRIAAIRREADIGYGQISMLRIAGTGQLRPFEVTPAFCN